MAARCSASGGVASEVELEPQLFLRKKAYDLALQHPRVPQAKRFRLKLELKAGVLRARTDSDRARCVKFYAKNGWGGVPLAQRGALARSRRRAFHLRLPPWVRAGRVAFPRCSVDQRQVECALARRRTA